MQNPELVHPDYTAIPYGLKWEELGTFAKQLILSWRNKWSKHRTVFISPIRWTNRRGVAKKRSGRLWRSDLWPGAVREESRDGNVHEQSCRGFEPRIFGSVDRRLIHWANKTHTHTRSSTHTTHSPMAARVEEAPMRPRRSWREGRGRRRVQPGTRLDRRVLLRKGKGGRGGTKQKS